MSPETPLLEASPVVFTVGHSTRALDDFHRSLIADALLVRGVQVEHILSATHRQPHRLTPWARVQGVKIVYPAEALPLAPA